MRVASFTVGTNWGVVISMLAGLLCLVGAIVAGLMRKSALGWYLVIAVYVCWFPIHLWFWQPALIDPRPVGGAYIGGAVFQISVPLIGLIVSCFFRFRPVLTAVLIGCLFSLVLQLFSYIYWSYGSTQNFSIRLSHLDSFYFALGTLTTAGTGSISAVSETARGLQTLQMGLDLVLVVFAVALVVARYSSLFDRRRRAEVRHEVTATARSAPAIASNRQSQQPNGEVSWPAAGPPSHPARPSSPGQTAG